jgi:hypothetical protein
MAAMEAKYQRPRLQATRRIVCAGIAQAHLLKRALFTISIIVSITMCIGYFVVYFPRFFVLILIQCMILHLLLNNSGWYGGRSGGFESCNPRPGDVDATGKMFSLWDELASAAVSV